MKQPSFVECSKCLCDAPDDSGWDVQPMMSRPDPFHAQLLYPTDGTAEQLRIGRGIKGIQTAAVDKISRIQITAFCFKKAAVPGRMPGRMQHCNAPTAKVNGITVVQDDLRYPVKDAVVLRSKVLGKGAWRPQQIAQDIFARKWKLAGEPPILCPVHGDAEIGRAHV